jgi:hypothetical protein
MARKGNIQLMENVFTVFILIFIGMVVLIFVGYNTYTNRVIEAQAQFEIEAIRIARSLQSLPELQCSIGEDTTDYCIDFLKAQAFAEIVRDDISVKELYFPMLGWSTITIMNLDSGTEHKNGITVYSNQRTSSVQAYHLPVLIEETPDITTLGYIRVEVPR